MELPKAKLHANNEGPGVPVEKSIYHRVRLDPVKVNHFLDFKNRPYFYQDAAYVTRTIKISSGERSIMPKVIRTVTRSTMIVRHLKNLFLTQKCGKPITQQGLHRIVSIHMYVVPRSTMNTNGEAEN